MKTNPKNISQVSTGADSDKRYFPRWQVKNRIVYRLEGDTHVHEARSRDLSCTGLCFLSQFPLSKEQKLKLRIYLFDDKSIEVEGHPVWVEETAEGHLVGLHFSDLKPKIQDTILQFAFEIKKDDVVKHWFEGWDKK